MIKTVKLKGWGKGQHQSAVNAKIKELCDKYSNVISEDDVSWHRVYEDGTVIIEIKVSSEFLGTQLKLSW